MWLTDLFIFYLVTQSFGEPWTHWSWLQLGGTAVLLFGTAVYNAPNAGSIKLQGQWYALGMNFHQEYVQIEQEAAAEPQSDEEWQHRMDTFQTRKNSSFFAERPQYTRS